MIKQKNNKGFWFYCGIILLFITVLVLIYTIIRLIYAFSSTSAARMSADKTSSQETTQTKTQAKNTSYQELPFYPNATEVNFQQTKGDGIDAIYETKKDVTSKELMDFYEEQLKLKGWQITLRDRDNKQLEALNQDGSKLRVWVYFAGGEDTGISYNINFRPPNSEPWLPIPVQ